MESCVSAITKKVKSGRMERIMNEENDCYHYVKGDAAEGPVVSEVERRCYRH